MTSNQGTLFTSYDGAGRVISSGRVSNPEEQTSETGGVFLGAIFDGALFWFDGGVPKLRPDAPDVSMSAAAVLADGKTSIELWGVPIGAKVANGQEIGVADGGVVFVSTNYVGWNRITIDAFPAKLWSGGFYGLAS